MFKPNPTNMHTLPPTNVCRYCGRTLTQPDAPIEGTSIYPFIPCDCEESKAAYAAMEQERREEEERAAAVKHRKRLDAAGIPKRFRGLEIDVGDYASVVKGGCSLILTGNVGTGKTSLACAVAEALIDSKTTKFTTIADINASLFDKEASESELFRSLSNTDLLILDDLDKGKLGEWSISLVYRVVNQRYEDCKPIIVTMNCGMPELKRRLTVKDDTTTAEAIVSRLYEMSDGLEINYGGRDKRLSKHG